MDTERDRWNERGERGGRDSGRQRGKQTRRTIDRWRAMICTDTSKHTHTHTHTHLPIRYETKRFRMSKSS